MFDIGVPILLDTPSVDGLNEALNALAEWQHEGASVPLHPGDVGWHWRFGAEATAAAVRTWSRDDRILAVGFLDGPQLLRLAMAPEAESDEELTREMVCDVSQPERGVLPAGKACIEARFGGLLPRFLADHGWERDEPWTPLVRDLAEPVDDSGVRVEMVGPEQAGVRAAVQRATFERSTFTEERWHTMAGGVAYGNARCLLAYDEEERAVATATVWSAGPGRPGLLEPMGVHRDHRHLGYGRAITLAAAAALQALGSSSATVCTRTANVGGVATYRSAGFEPLPEVRDLCRSAG